MAMKNTRKSFGSLERKITQTEDLNKVATKVYGVRPCVEERKLTYLDIPRRLAAGIQ